MRKDIIHDICDGQFKRDVISRCVVQHFLSQIALPNLGTAKEVATAVLFLASDKAGHITGIELPVDGGVTAK
ncbi:hypothetical protein AS030_20890 [Fictibacillus enclensis]|uniref:SDR family oxidoreductase n=1 Tax=Fictibacillus enclensis TaxID=1017270 RepID=A0A0V8IZZ4_9BACL|nr:hypothetical protein AS030_20890 [Fictibacillus enclensis]